jgi:hypothetical protein
MSSVQFVREELSRTAVAGILALLASCDNPTKPPQGSIDPPNISRVTIKLTSGGTTVQSERIDPDGSQLPQPMGAARGTLTLTKGTTYSGSILLKNDTDPNNVIDISAEIKDEANFYRFIYTFSCNGAAPAINAPASSFDKDTQSPTPQPVGLTFQLVVDPAAAACTNGTLHVELRHFETNKGEGLGSNFETRLNIDFPFTIA